MQSVESIYATTIKPLPVEDQKRLADMILENTKDSAAAPKRSVLEIIESIRANSPKRSAAEIDEYLRAERDSWDD